MAGILLGFDLWEGKPVAGSLLGFEL